MNALKSFFSRKPDQPTTSARFRRQYDNMRGRQKRRAQPPKPFSCRKTFEKTYEGYTTETTIHGCHYLNLHNSLNDMILWIVLMTTTVLICIYFIVLQYKSWDATPVILTFSETDIPVSNIPFPAVTICPATKFEKNAKIDFDQFYRDMRAFVNASKVFETPAKLDNDQFLKMRSLLQVCDSSIVNDIVFPEYPPVDFVKHLLKLAPTFENDFPHCGFNQTAGKCASFFEKTYTSEGVCYTFNGLNATELYREGTYQFDEFKKDDQSRRRHRVVDWSISKGYSQIGNYDTYPARAIGSWPRTGLIVFVQGFKKDYDFLCRGSLQGFKVILHSPDNVPQPDKRFFHVSYQQDIQVAVKPQLLYTTESMKNISPKRRNCYYPEERYLKFFRAYTRNNCQIECVANFTLSRCGCVKFSMPRLKSTKVCDASQILCYDKADNDFLQSAYTKFGEPNEKCECLPGCWELNYDVQLTDGIYDMKRKVEGVPDDLYESKDDTRELSRLKFFFHKNEFTALKRSEFNTMTDFIAQCGGLCGLLMGLTVANCIEIIYHFTIRWYQNTENS